MGFCVGGRTNHDQHPHVAVELRAQGEGGAKRGLGLARTVVADEDPAERPTLRPAVAHRSAAATASATTIATSMYAT